MSGRSHGKYRMKAPKTGLPKLRAWGRPGQRKVATQVILSKKEKLQKRARQKDLLKKALAEEL